MRRGYRGPAHGTAPRGLACDAEVRQMAARHQRWFATLDAATQAKLIDEADPRPPVCAARAAKVTK